MRNTRVLAEMKAAFKIAATELAAQYKQVSGALLAHGGRFDSLEGRLRKVAGDLASLAETGREQAGRQANVLAANTDAVKALRDAVNELRKAWEASVTAGRESVAQLTKVVASNTSAVTSLASAVSNAAAPAAQDGEPAVTAVGAGTTSGAPSPAPARARAAKGGSAST